MTSLSIGLYVEGGAEHIRASIDSLLSHTSRPFQLVLLGDGPDQATRRALEGFSAWELSVTDEPQGAASCFDRLTRLRDAENYILLESGALPGPGWLDRILVALDRMPHCGIAGPSTNFADTVQCLMSQSEYSDGDPATIARTVARRFGSQSRTLGPTQNLADFCYVVRRAVVDAIGGADEGLGREDCWAAAHHDRARRAGFASLWVCGAYVHRRLPISRRTHRAQLQQIHGRIETIIGRDNTRNYRRNGFAVGRVLAMPPDAVDDLAPPTTTFLGAPAAASTGRSLLAPSTNGGEPLASCIMPTCNRRKFVPRALRCFFAQDYPNLELVVVDDGTDPIRDLLPNDPRIRYVRLHDKQTIGAKRNLACAEARGEFILHWDDDDWSPYDRASRQIESLRQPGVEISGTSTVFYYRESNDTGYRYQSPALVPIWMAGLAYRKSVWQRQPFEPIQIAEDVKFLASVPPEGRLDLRQPGLYVAFIHDANAAPKETAGSCWIPEQIETLRAVAGDELKLRADVPKAPQRTPAVRRSECSAPAGLRQGVSVVIPHGGSERLPHLAASLANLRQCGGVDEIIVVDMGPSPVAREPARRWGAKYVFVRNDVAFERARALDVGSSLAMYDLVLWKDNDLLMSGDFIATAASEIRRRNLDYLIPYSQIRYLAERDSKAVMEGLQDPAHSAPTRILTPGGQITGGAGLVRKDFLLRCGGIPEGFRGWGGEDNAWTHKASLLGTTAITASCAQQLFHLYHAGSGAHDATVHHQNPYYADNLSLLTRITSIRNRRQFLEQFPARAAYCPWPSDNRIVFVSPADGSRLDSLAHRAAEGLRQLLDIEVAVVSAGVDAKWVAPLVEREPDAVVCFDQATAATLLSRDNLTQLHQRVIVVSHGAAAPPADTGPLSLAAALCPVIPALDAALPIRPLSFALPPDESPAAEIGAALVQPLSIALGEALAPRNQSADMQGNRADDAQHPVWIYWEGHCPEWVATCRRTISAHALDVRLLDRDSFERIRDRDRDIDIDRLQVAHRADFIRAFLLARYGGLWLDSDCIVTKPLAPLIDLLNVHDFIAHRDRQGFFPNGFIGARRGSVIAAEFYRRVCGILRSGRPLGWISLGGEPLTNLLRHTNVAWHELECELIQPVCWSRPDVFFAVASRDDHERAFNDRAFCYMLSNTEIKKYAAQHPGRSLMHVGSFFNFLIEKSADKAAHNGCESKIAPRVERVRAAEEMRAAKTRRDTKLAAERLGFYLSQVADIAPRLVLEVSSEPSPWLTLLCDREAAAPRDADGVAPPIAVHRIVPIIAVDTAWHRQFSESVTRGEFRAPPHEQDRRWDLLIVSEALSAWSADAGGQFVAEATAIADYVLIWDWCEIGSAGAATPTCTAGPWHSAVRSSRTGTVENCRFGAYLLSRTDPRGIGRGITLERVFEQVFRDNSRIGDESVSGPGSCLAQTAEIRRSLPHLLQSISARSLLDVPCGDFNWMKCVALALDEYIGVDIVSDLITANQTRYGGADRRFIKADLTRDDLPVADVVLCRDCLVHFSYDDIRRALRNIKRSNSTYLLTTTFPKLRANADIVTGQWRPLNLELEPFNFPMPIRVVVEGCTEAGGRYADKSLALWRLSDIAQSDLATAT